MDRGDRDRNHGMGRSNRVRGPNRETFRDSPVEVDRKDDYSKGLFSDKVDPVTGNYLWPGLSSDPIGSRVLGCE